MEDFPALSEVLNINLPVSAPTIAAANDMANMAPVIAETDGASTSAKRAEGFRPGTSDRVD